MLITSIEKSDKNNGMLLVYIDNSYAFSLPEEDYLRLGFYEKKEISEEEIHYVKYDVNLRAAKAAGVKFLALKLRTEREVREKLSGQGFAEDIIDKAVEELETLGYINDPEYTEKYIRSKLKLKPTSKRMLLYELESRGIQKEMVLSALEGFEVDELSIAEALVLKKFARYDFKEQKTKKKIQAFLGQRGFGYGIINEILSKLT